MAAARPPAALRPAPSTRRSPWPWLITVAASRWLQLPFTHSTYYYGRVSGDPDTLPPHVQMPYRFSDWVVSRDTELALALA